MIELVEEFHISEFIDKYFKDLKNTIVNNFYDVFYIYADSLISIEEFRNITDYYFYFKTDENTIVKAMPVAIEKESYVLEGEKSVICFSKIEEYGKHAFKIVEENGFYVVKRNNKMIF